MKDASYLSSIKKLFAYYRRLGEQAIEQLEEEELFWQPHEEVNSIAILVNHMAGNLISRFTDFLESDGEKPWRNRDAEFENPFQNREALMARWHQGWEVLMGTLDSLKPEDLDRRVYIRQEGHQVWEAIDRQLAHHAYHVGQIVFLAKSLRASSWKSLSIPRHQSDAYNQRKFSRPRENRHFTDEV